MSLREAPIEVIRTYPFIPKVDGNRYETYFQNSGMDGVGHDKHKHRWNQECGETALWIIQRYIIIFNRHLADFILTVGIAGYIMAYLYILVHLKRDIGGRDKQRLVIQHT